jgi:hypothetical protein
MTAFISTDDHTSTVSGASAERIGAGAAGRSRQEATGVNYLIVLLLTAAPVLQRRCGFKTTAPSDFLTILLKNFRC